MFGWFANPIYGGTDYVTSTNTDQSAFGLTNFTSNELRDIKGLYNALIHHLILNTYMYRNGIKQGVNYSRHN